MPRVLLPLFLLLAWLAPGPARADSPPTDITTLTGQHIVGYQGWFACPGDGRSGTVGQTWVHWFTTPSGGTPVATVDMLPDMTGVPVAERCATNWVNAAGTPITLYSAQRPATVARHFAWMEGVGINTAAASRFVSGLTSATTTERMDKVLDNIRAGAEAHSRGFFIMYDITGLTAAQLPMLTADWRAQRARGLTSGPAYQQHDGKPVVLIWGLGFKDRAGDATEAAALLAAVRAEGPVTIIGGVPTGWLTLDSDSNTDPNWAGVYASFDILSPWTVGRYGPGASYAAHNRDRLQPDLAETRRRGQGYLPVIFPGFSWHNLLASRGQVAALNQISRGCGNFYWEQARGAGDASATMMFTAMFDEVDEGTAIFRTQPTSAAQPSDPTFLALDADGCNLPSNWYLRLAGNIARRIGTPNWPDSMPMVLP